MSNKLESEISSNLLVAWRSEGILSENEVAFKIGDLFVAENVITRERRVINPSLKEAAGTKRVLKGWKLSSDSKIINFDNESRDELLSGVEILSNAVSVTMGPMGMNVVIEKGRMGTFTVRIQGVNKKYSAKRVK